MGRITIFSLDDCPHCFRAKKAMKERRVPFLEISLTQYPQKRDDMTSLCNQMTVPQIFMNEEHVGGTSKILKLLEQTKKGRVVVLRLLGTKRMN